MFRQAPQPGPHQGKSLAAGLGRGNSREERLGIIGLWIAEDARRRAGLDHEAVLHDDDMVGERGNDCQIVRDEDQALAGRLHGAQQGEDLRLHDHVERRGRLVGNQHLRFAGNGRGDQRALTQAARELMGILADARLRIGNADRGQEVEHALAGLAAGHAPMLRQCLADFGADGLERIERNQGVLQNKADMAAAHAAPLARREAHEIDLSQEHSAGVDAGIVAGKAHEGSCGRGFPRTRFPDDGDALAGIQREGQIIDCDDLVAGSGKADAQIFNSQKPHHALPSEMALRWRPTTVVETMVAVAKTPGKTPIHQALRR